MEREPITKTLYEIPDDEIVGVSVTKRYANLNLKNSIELMTAGEYKKLVLSSVAATKYGRKPNGHQRTDEVYSIESV